MPLKISAMISLSLLMCAAIFGFFYAWVCSTMWGLDTADPRIAIAAMQAMNGSVRNAVFAPAFFGTPLVLAITTWLLWTHNHKASAKTVRAQWCGLSVFWADSDDGRQCAHE